MVASKTSILVAAVALGAVTVYAAPATLNKDISLSRRKADKSALMARKYDDGELYAREFYDDLDARDFEDGALEARDFDDDELYARELYDEELAARGFDDDEEVLFARGPEGTDTTKSDQTLAANTGTGASKGASVPEYCTTIVDALKIIHERKHADKQHDTQSSVHRRVATTLPDAQTIARDCGPSIQALHHHHHHHHQVDGSSLPPTSHSTTSGGSDPNVSTGNKSKRGLTRRVNDVTSAPPLNAGGAQGGMTGGVTGGVTGGGTGTESTVPPPQHHHRHRRCPACHDKCPGPECHNCHEQHCPRHHALGQQHEQQEQKVDSQMSGGQGTTGGTKLRRRSVGDDLYWKRNLATSLGLEAGYFDKRYQRD